MGKNNFVANTFKQAGNLVGDITGSNRQAEAAENAAIAANTEALAQREAVTREGRRVESEAMGYAAASPQELRSYEGALTAAFKQNDQDIKLMDSIDPALMEASGQVLSLLRGEQTSMGGTYEKSRETARTKLVDSLRAQFGPGAEASAIGQRALQDFDAKSAEGSFGMQQQSLGSLMGLINARPTAANSFGMLTQAGNNFGGIQQRQTNAKLQGGSNMLAALSGANQAVMQTTGAQYVGEQVRGQAQQQFVNTMINAGASVMGAKKAP